MIGNVTEQTTRKIKVELAIEANSQTLREKFENGKREANHSERAAGLCRAFAHLNTLLPKNIRQGLTFPECEVFNTWVIGYLSQLLGV